jgi:hypothetical protein
VLQELTVEVGGVVTGERGSVEALVRLGDRPLDALMVGEHRFTDLSLTGVVDTERDRPSPVADELGGVAEPTHVERRQEGLEAATWLAEDGRVGDPDALEDHVRRRDESQADGGRRGAHRAQRRR